jgi:hypothetical protein
MNDITYEIFDHICTLKETEDGWTKELNIVAWNGAAPKYDLREWSPDHSRMSRGITLTAEEMEQILQEMDDLDACSFMETAIADFEEERK